MHTPLATRYAIIDPSDASIIDGETYGDLPALYHNMSYCSSAHHSELRVFAFDFIRGTLTDITDDAIAGWWHEDGFTDTRELKLAEEPVSVFAEMLKRMPSRAPEHLFSDTATDRMMEKLT